MAITTYFIVCKASMLSSQYISIEVLMTFKEPSLLLTFPSRFLARPLDMNQTLSVNWATSQSKVAKKTL